MKKDLLDLRRKAEAFGDVMVVPWVRGVGAGR